MAEAYSSPIMTQMAQQLGYREGFALDLTVDDEHGKGWDLSIEEVLERALKLLEETRPLLLVVSPPCTPLQSMNYPKMESEDLHNKLKDGITHLGFAVLLCLKQAKMEGKFMLEPPAGATSWGTLLRNKLHFVEDTVRVNFDFCTAGMVVKTKTGEALARKRTGMFTNSKAIAEEMKKHQCDGCHEHAELIDGLAKHAQLYPDKFCKIILKAAMKEKNEHHGLLGLLTDAKDAVNEITDVTKEVYAMMEHPHDEDKYENGMQQLYQEFDFIDDNTGKPLKHDLAIQARRTEIEFFRKMRV